MKKFPHFDWLRAVQFIGNTVPKKEIQCEFLMLPNLCFLTTHVYL